MPEEISVNIVSNLTMDFTFPSTGSSCKISPNCFLESSPSALSDCFLFILSVSEWQKISDTAQYRNIRLKTSVLIFPPAKTPDPELSRHPEIFSCLPEISDEKIFNPVLETTAKSAMEKLQQEKELQSIRQNLEWESVKLKQLNEIGKSLSSIADPNILLNLILKKSRELTNADAGSICLVRYDNEDNPVELLYSYFQNDTLRQDMKVDLKIPATKKSLAGYVALTSRCLKIDEAYDIGPECEYQFNRDVDKSTGYRTKSMLVHPMVDNEARVLGVVQLLNKKSRSYIHSGDKKVDIENIIDFTEEDVEIIHSLTSQAAICLKNTTLIQEIQDLFEGFVNASVTAIEQRDPTTSGHSVRVAMMTCELARAVSMATEGPYKDIVFSEQEIQELRYAGLLHDFGKINISEEVLVKAKKLYPYEMENLRIRFDYIIRDAQARMLEKKVDLINSVGYEQAMLMFPTLEEEKQQIIAEIEDILYFIIQSNEPTPMEEGNFQRLVTVANRLFSDPYGHNKSYLSEHEVKSLSIRKGTLTAEERQEIENHVTHSFTFLSKIPWPKGLRQIPAIAYGHHEWLSGNGYPNKLTESEILLTSKMMAIADIYDALTASDRPYKKAIPVERALKIIEFEVKDNHLDAYLVDLFVKKEIYKIVENC